MKEALFTFRRCNECCRIVNWAVKGDFTVLQNDSTFAQRLYGVDVVTHHKHGFTLTAKFLHFRVTLRTERRVTDRKHLVNEQNVDLRVDGDRKAKPRIHTRAVSLYLGIDKLTDA